MNTIDANQLARFFLAGAKNLEVKKGWINELNVFPVPDGDTGTNMTLTIMSAVREVNALENVSMTTLAKAISSGSLRGARGNSGVILSQLLRGFTKAIKTEETLDAIAIASAFDKGVETAYKAVMKPKEGTILTVARGMAQKAVELCSEAEDLQPFFEAILEEGRRVLASTPDLLPVLKEAGVVDSGGQGLIVVLEGAFEAYMGREIELTFEAGDAGHIRKEPEEEKKEIRFGYLAEYLLIPDKPFTEEAGADYREYLQTIGDLDLCEPADGAVRTRVYTDDPGLALQKGLAYGALTGITVSNLRIKDGEGAGAPAESAGQETAQPITKKNGFISVTVGGGFGQIFKDLGADCLIEGGQTMNPSTEDMLQAIAKVPAENIFILPNNKNIILAANQAKELTTDKNIIVIPTKTVPQGITAMISYVPEKSVEENTEDMEEAIRQVKTAQITYAIRDTHIDDKEIHEGDIMGIGDEGLLAVGRDVTEVAQESIRRMVTEESELISIYYGEGYSEEEAEALASSLEELYDACDIEVNAGGQPVYYCIISVE